MSEWGFWPRFAVAVLAVWRVTHLLAREDGPADLVYRLRARLGNSVVGRAMDCFRCLSAWVAAPFASYVAGSWLDRAVTWLALSGAACLLESVTAARAPLDPVKEVMDVVLRPEEDLAGGPDGPDGDCVPAGSVRRTFHSRR